MLTEKKQLKEVLIAKNNSVTKVTVEEVFENPIIRMEFFEAPKKIKGDEYIPPTYVEIYGEEHLLQIKEAIEKGLKVLKEQKDKDPFEEVMNI